MSIFQKSESNIDKLSFKEQLKLIFFRPDQFIKLFSKQTKKPESTVEYTTDDIQEKTYTELSRLNQEQLEPLFNDQVSHLEQGATEISQKINDIKSKDPKAKEDPSIEHSTIETATIHFGQTQTKQSSDKER